MPKRLCFVFFLILSIYGTAFSQVSDEIREELINLWTLYAQSRTGNDRLQYIRNQESYRDIFLSRYGNRDIGYTPIGFGRAGRTVTSSNLDIYILEELVRVHLGERRLQIILRRYFVKVDNLFKIDWEASVGYNPVTFSRFKALQDGQIARMRCYANLETSRYDEYFGIGIRDELTNFQFRAYIRKNSEDGILLLEYLERGGARPVILEMNYVDHISRYDKEVLITNFVMRGWVE